MAWNTVFSEVRAIKQQFDVVFPISVNQEIIWFQIGMLWDAKKLMES